MLSELGNIGDFVSGIAVVVTLVYLATQVRQHTMAMRTASRQDLSSAYRAHNSRLLDPRTSEAYAIGLRSYPGMAPADKRTFAHAINDQALFLQNAFALYESDSLGLENYLPYLTWFACSVSTPGGSAWWRETKTFYNEALVASVDERLRAGDLPDILEHGFFALED